MTFWVKTSRPFTGYNYVFHYAVDEDFIKNFATMEGWCYANLDNMGWDWDLEFYPSSYILVKNDCCAFYFMDMEIAIQFKLMWPGKSDRIVVVDDLTII